MYRVMIVDDEPIVLESLSSILPWEALECELVGTASNGMDAFNSICDFYPDIVITDVRMPIMNGLELIERSGKLDRNIDFVVLSGYDDFSFAQTAMKYGVKYYHLKPARKEELTDTLRKIVASRRLSEEMLRLQEQNIVEKLRLPLQKSFLFDALNRDFLPDETLLGYSRLLGIPEAPVSLCICSFLEEGCLELFRRDFFRTARRHSIFVLWPAFYVTNSFVFLYTAPDLKAEDQLRAFIRGAHYPTQSVELDCMILHFDSTVAALREIIRKISRYHTIFLMNGLADPEVLNNTPLSAHNTQLWKTQLEELHSEYEVDCIVEELFSAVSDVENAILLGIRLILSSFSGTREPDYFSLQYLYRSTSVDEVRSITTGLLLRQLPASAKEGSSREDLIPRVREYIDRHLDCESLSLKWLAENQFFISVGYLSRQFLAEEGEHFSYYLNRRRVELAKKLMSVYHNNNIQDIAEQVGFRNNPRYFSQVFKKFTGMTPSEYMSLL